MDGFEEVIEEFLIESYESLDQLDRDLLALEDTPEDRDRLASIFRTVHTIKGTSGFLAFPKLERVAHVGENLLVPLRDGDFDLTRKMADSLLQMVDAIREILTNIESKGIEGDQEYENLVTQLEQLKNGDTAEAQPTEPQTTAPQSAATPAAATTAEAGTAVPNEPAAETITQTETPSSSEPTVAETVDTQPKVPPVQDPAPLAVEAPKNETSKPRAAETEPAAETTDRTQSVADSTVRINVDLLDKLMNLVGELVLSRNQIIQFSETIEDPAMIAASQRLNLITTELQEGVMKTRMQPIRNAWSKLPRVVRDLSASCGKNVEVVMEGAATELDKTILEALKDPLTHIVRNSVDHGIESAEIRESNGKPAKGVLCLRAFHEGGHVNIEIADDGGGISSQRVRDKALEKGLITEEQADRMSERELINLILLPGFSTAAKVTNVSGRGVGMDVVKTNIERIGGTIDIQSETGRGTTLRIKIPLTLAIVPALIVKTDGEQYAIPQVSLLELLRLDNERARTQIEYIHDTPVYRLRGNLLPLVYLDEQLELRQKNSSEDQPESVNIVVLHAEDQPFGLVVDMITDTQEIVVKPLGCHLKNISTYAGTTIMGDGTVALILDVFGLASKSSVLTEHRSRALQSNGGETVERNADRHEMLIVDPGDQSRAAIELSTVARLEEFDSAKIERSGHSDVVQYRGKIMPLIYLNGYSPASQCEGSTRLNTVVFASEENRVGIVVGKILDIVHQKLDMSNGKLPARCVVQDRVTEIIDLSEVVRANYPELLAPSAV
ncbi:MAG: chemotaxis protein CheA [Mariniblastus sp.]